MLDTKESTDKSGRYASLLDENNINLFLFKSIENRVKVQMFLQHPNTDFLRLQISKNYKGEEHKVT